MLSRRKLRGLMYRGTYAAGELCNRPHIVDHEPVIIRRVSKAITHSKAVRNIFIILSTELPPHLRKESTIRIHEINKYLSALAICRVSRVTVLPELRKNNDMTTFVHARCTQKVCPDPRVLASNFFTM